MYDSEHWIEQYGDPGHKRNVAIARVSTQDRIEGASDQFLDYGLGCIARIY